jgi:trk system potassium uptake protein TrkA
MFVIIMGCGRMGSELATLLSSEGHGVTIIDTDANSFKYLPESFNGVALRGDGINREFLERINIEKADAFVALTRSDNRNIMASQVARRIFSVSKVVCRVYDPPREELYRTLGLEIISTTRVGSQLLRDAILE